MSELVNRIGDSIRTWRLFRPGQSILVAVSGGVDSMVLLQALHELAPRHGWRLTVAHLNHQLRGRSSDADERLVRRAAAGLNLPARVGRADVRRMAREQKLSLEMAARKARHDFLARTAAEMAIPTIALAHHADDQLELFFLRLLRGSGGEGLAGMKWRNPSPSDPKIELVRPLLDQPKSALREYALQENIPFREDASNAALDIQRNRIRHELLPLLRRKYQPALDKTVLRVMEILGAEAEFAGQVAREWLEGKSGKRKAESGKRKAANGRPMAFAELPVAVQRRCLHAQLVGQGIEPDYELIEQLRTRAGRAVAVGWGRKRKEEHSTAEPLAKRHAQMNRRGATSAEKTDESKSLRHVVRDEAGVVHVQESTTPKFKSGCLEVARDAGAGETVFDGVRIRWRIVAGKTAGRPKAATGREVFDADEVGSPILLRHWQAGDRFQPIGLAHPVKLQDLFTNAKVARARRHELIVAATAQGEIFWVEGLRIAERFKLNRQTIRHLQWRWQRL